MFLFAVGSVEKRRHQMLPSLTVGGLRGKGSDRKDSLTSTHPPGSTCHTHQLCQKDGYTHQRTHCNGNGTLTTKKVSHVIWRNNGSRACVGPLDTQTALSTVIRGKGPSGEGDMLFFANFVQSSERRRSAAKAPR